VVHGEDQQLIGITKPHHDTPQQRCGRQVERPLSLGGSVCPCHGFRVVTAAHVHDVDHDPRVRQHLLGRFTVHQEETGPQSVVPRHHRVHRRLKRRRVQVSPHPQHDRDVVGDIAMLKLVHEPQAPLHRRQAIETVGHSDFPQFHSCSLLGAGGISRTTR
jgi:hypothetical protein